MNHEASNYILSVLLDWERRFEGIRLKYAYDTDFNCHIIEVEPNELFNRNEEYALAELQLWETFAKKFAEDEILICEPDSRNDMTHLIYKTQSDSVECQSKALIVEYTPGTSVAKWDGEYSKIHSPGNKQYINNSFLPIKPFSAFKKEGTTVNESYYMFAA